VQGKLYRQGQDKVLRHGFKDSEIPIVFHKMHEGIDGGHFSFEITICKILDAKYWWPIMHKDVLQYCQAYDNYQQTWNFKKNNITKLVTSLLTKPL
jgi:hypothetical protein